MDVFIAKVFATVSSVKAAYAHLQVAQSPYDPNGIQLSDQIMVDELKRLSEFKKLFLKNHIDDDISPHETTLLLAEIQELKNQVLMYEVMVKKLDSQNRLRESEIIFLKENLNETCNENRMIEKRLNSSGGLRPLSFNSSRVNSFYNFLLSVRQMTSSIKGFVKVMMEEMEDAKWDLNAAASVIQPKVVFRDTSDECFAFKSFVCRVMFEGFNNSGFLITTEGNESHSPRSWLDSFMQLKSLKARDCITWKPNSMFAKFCYLKYLKLVHPVMEFSLFGNLNQRNAVSGGQFPETAFFAAFADMARKIRLLHCLAFAFDSNANVPSVYQVKDRTRYTEVYMESVNEGSPTVSPEVGFMVVPGFKMGGSVIQCQVYLT
ncbi:protein GRAVITROPIC IN THE LIGHT 1-like [Bidens hawaiensis]|uniref:protein GRAVITROPIC IN THE LIGHT 1-like n=1 Tax=Bidens hawaiensis TaxID=980011 RepID=UPI00404B6167